MSRKNFILEREKNFITLGPGCVILCLRGRSMKSKKTWPYIRVTKISFVVPLKKVKGGAFTLNGFCK